MPFIDKELQKLSQDILNRAVQKQSGVPGTTSISPVIDNIKRLAQQFRRPQP